MSMIRWSELKELVVLDVGVAVLGFLLRIINVLSAVTPLKDGDNKDKFDVEKVKTKKYHIRIFIDRRKIDDPMIIVKSRGFLKKWEAFDTDSIPKNIVTEVFSDSCTPKRRKRVIGKVMDLKAFW